MRCFYCGREIEEGVVCGRRECRKQYRRDMKKVDQDFEDNQEVFTIKCNICGEEFESDSKFLRYCSNCRRFAQEGISRSLYGFHGCEQLDFDSQLRRITCQKQLLAMEL